MAFFDAIYAKTLFFGPVFGPDSHGEILLTNRPSRSAPFRGRQGGEGWQNRRKALNRLREIRRRFDMKTTLAAMALALALPAAAFAQAAPGPDDKPKMECCCKDKDKPMACCDEHGKAGEPAKDGHEGHGATEPQP